MLLLLWLLVNLSLCVANKCENLPPTKTEYQDWGFNRKNPDGNFGFLKEYILITCCGENYDSLVWLHEGKPYPWKRCNQDNSCSRSHKLDHRNMTLEIRSIGPGDGGRYTCIMRKGSQELVHHFFLQLAPADRDRAAVMYHRPQNQTAELGQNVTFDCVARFGADGFSLLKVIFWRVSLNDSIMDRPVTDPQFPRYQATKGYRNNRQIIENNLTVTNVQEQDYNAVFTCIVTNRLDYTAKVNVFINKPGLPEPPVPGPYRVVLSTIAAILLLVIVVIVLVWNYRLELQICGKDAFGKQEKTDRITHDAFFVYSEENVEDRLLVTAKILDRVEDMKYSALLSDKDFMPGSARAEEYVRCMDASSRFIVILSPSFLSDTLCNFALDVALERKKNIIFIMHRDVENWEQYENQRIMKSIMSVKKKLYWPEKESKRNLDKFYKRLRLQLPAQRSVTRHPIGVQTLSSNETNNSIGVSKNLQTMESQPEHGHNTRQIETRQDLSAV